jgi:hypothetical protein
MKYLRSRQGQQARYRLPARAYNMWQRSRGGELVLKLEALARVGQPRESWCFVHDMGEESAVMKGGNEWRRNDQKR